MPEINNFACWNHLKKNAKFWLKDNHITSIESMEISGNLKTLLESYSQSYFEEQLSKYYEKWPLLFKNYFDKNLKMDCLTSSRFMVTAKTEKYNNIDVTSNASETTNSVIHNLTKKRKTEISDFVETMHMLQLREYDDIRQALTNNMGEYSIKREFQNKLKSYKFEDVGDSLTIEQMMSMQLKGIFPAKKEIKLDQNKKLLQRGIADFFYKNDRVYFDSKYNVFLIKGLDNNTHMVNYENYFI